MRTRHIGEFLKSEFHNGRAAGMGIVYDRYDEESGPGVNTGGRTTLVTFLDDEEARAPGPVAIYRMEDSE